jgi:DNA-binding response OmpR family regulator
VLFLEELSYEGGEYAISCHRPDLVILEIELQGKSGIKLLKEIKSLSISTTVILFTHHLSEDFKSLCLEHGADYFFDKCKNFGQMLEVINSLVKQYELQ